MQLRKNSFRELFKFIVRVNGYETRSACFRNLIDVLESRLSFKENMQLKAILAICGVFVGCCSNVVFLEFIVRSDPGAGHLVTFAQFFFIALHGLVSTSKFFSVKRIIPMRDYAILVTMFYVSTVCNNYAFNFNIPMPLLMIFRSGSLLANMIMGILILNKKYDFWKYLSVILITIGICICTIVSGMSLESKGNEILRDKEYGFSMLFWWCIGIGMLTISLFVSARMGIFQEVLFKKNGKHPDEALFYAHLLPLPGFIPLLSNILDHASIASKSPPMFIPVLAIEMPSQVLYIIGNVLTQFLCIRSVYILTTECSSLTVTLVVTLRKFTSLIFSIFYFRNAFTSFHWLGTVFVFIGTVIFVEIIPKIRESCETRQQMKTIDKFYLDSTPRVHVKYKPLLQVDEEHNLDDK
ncbi:UDP-xylose and UDP-N-acetylglucosamine transporter-like [Chironomus tepperi]|uniref:UDP-xylose and UDP-N-acetylglucosamine transporter-like n=1 Tax=Chironomus tepperi TaxID=113505 RepID=UPI00391F6C9E